ncbi:MAG TPA: vitamin B12-dependent ribonucleotide reductase, partial [Thermoanaerobaculia bacterium]
MSSDKGVDGTRSVGVGEERRESQRQTLQGQGGLKGLTFTRVYSDPSVSPYDAIEWELRTAAILSEKGETIFEQKNVEVPKSWSQTATNIVVQKYFHGRIGTPDRESSVRQLIERVAGTITGYGEKGGYFRTAADRDAFHDELAAILVNQVASFNSPVWFNVGIEPKPQGSACFINSCGDSMDSILSLAKTEGMLFKYGSGTGSNLSSIRGSHESLSAGGTASGPLSFMKGFDSFAGAIKSGGKTRRAAKMVILNIDHPDIDEFINSKANEEKKAWALIDAGYDGSFNGEAYASIFYQNANHSVRVTDEFMDAVENDAEWQTKEVLTGRPYKTYKARELMAQIADSAWVCGDPGMQYDSTINRWNPVKATHRINASNPCSEYMFVDDSACNLASLNLMKFFNAEDGSFDVQTFKHACDVVITAQEMLVDNCSYPTPAIAQNSYKFRPLGLGYANLGALLMAAGIPYDSDEGRAYAGAITSLMCGEAYLQSSKVSAELGPFAGYPPNRDAFLEVIGMHKDAAYDVPAKGVPAELHKAQKAVWDAALESGREHGYKNGQVTVLAPTGTIGFMMDCDTTGVEPDLALVKYKKLVGGGTIKIVNQTVPLALRRLGYSTDSINEIVDYVDEKGTIEGAPNFLPEHLPVFDCAFRALNGTRSIHYMGHVKMMAATQPFLSGAISKTVNLPPDASPEDIAGVYMEGWKQGLKAIAIYRDGCKRTQPLNTAASKSDTKSPVARGTLEYVGKA